MSNKNYTSEEVRNLFFEYFQSQKHEIQESASLVPINDDSLLWINSGVAALKEYFDGRKTPKNPRIVSIQKCIRTNDIENVGVTSRHQTFFEMMGNFSIGDYFKEEAIKFAWEFLTSEKYLNLPKEKFYITVFKEDQVAYDFWINEIKIDQTHIFKMDKDTNFWDMGQGPCGPCSEIFFDRGEKFDPEKIGPRLLSEDIENDRYVEVWNIVFSEYNNDGMQNYTKLNRQNIDTGMGFERLITVLQNKNNNFETDLFMPMIEKIEQLSSKQFKQAINLSDQQFEINKNIKVIADHTRSVVMALSDGAVITNEGRGYVLRRLVRRAMLAGHKLGIEDAFITKIAKIVCEKYGQTYANIIEQQPIILQILEIEETQFRKTLAKGIIRFNRIFEETKKITEEDAFKLFDTYGFPFEMTNEMAFEHGIRLSHEKFKSYLEKQIELSRKNAKITVGMLEQKDWMTKVEPNTKFLGYENLSVITTIKNIIVNDQFKTEAKMLDSTAIIVVNETSFYPEGGGQICDKGEVYSLEGKLIAKVNNVYKIGDNAIAHELSLVGTIKLEEKIEMRVDKQIRDSITKNHSSTHLTHTILDQLLQQRINQAGAFYDENRFRFDFNFMNKLPENLIQKINVELEKQINNNYETQIFNMKLDEARAMGAHALFEDKYEDIVRVVKINDSIELCGGTHVQSTKEIEKALITNIESKGSGVYRIEGIAGLDNVNKYLSEKAKIENEKLALEKQKLEAEKAKLQNNIKEQDIILETSYLTNIENFEQLKIVKKEFENKLKLKIKTTIENQKISQFSKIEPKLVKEVLNQQLKMNNLNDLKLVIIIDEDRTNLIVATPKDLVDLKSLTKKLQASYQVKGGGNNEICQFIINPNQVNEIINTICEE